MNHFRHGDVNIAKTDKIEENYKKVGEGRFTLAEGEVTGHHHVITAKTKEDSIEVYADEKGNLAIKVNGKAVLTHPEHKTIEIPTGIYKQTIEREKDWFSLAVRSVKD